MPFTLAHPAILIPLFKKKMRLSVTGLVAGSMVPDFEFFFRLKVTENIGHHPVGVLLLDLPLAFLLCFIFHNLVRNQFIYHLPLRYQSRVLSGIHFDWNNYFRQNSITVLISIFIGILSHFFLDGFTHYDGVFVRIFPFLSSKIAVAQFEVPVYGLLQGLFSVAGLLLLYCRIEAMPRLTQQIHYPTSLQIFWFLITFTSCFILTIRMLLMPGYQTFWDIIIAIIGSFIYASMAISAIYVKMEKIIMQD